MKTEYFSRLPFILSLVIAVTAFMSVGIVFAQTPPSDQPSITLIPSSLSQKLKEKYDVNTIPLKEAFSPTTLVGEPSLDGYVALVNKASAAPSPLIKEIKVDDAARESIKNSRPLSAQVQPGGSAVIIPVTSDMMMLDIGIRIGNIEGRLQGIQTDMAKITPSSALETKISGIDQRLFKIETYGTVGNWFLNLGISIAALVFAILSVVIAVRKQKPQNAPAKDVAPDKESWFKRVFRK